MIKKIIVDFLDKLPYVKGLRRDLNSYEKWGLPGHFYNPIPDINEVKQYEQSLFQFHAPHTLKDIDFNENEQFHFVQNIVSVYKELPFTNTKQNNTLYYFDNPNFSYSDAIFLYSMIRVAKPKRIIEIGSGFSSCVTLDTNRLFFDNSIKCTFIEPYPSLLEKLVSNYNHKVQIISQKVQDVDKELFTSLQENDILFVDSSHVMKTGSDLQHILFNVIPLLNKGVYIHFHDIFYPFEYPKDWVFKENRAWNELYVLRAFLMNNKDYKMVIFPNFLIHHHHDWFASEMPLCLKNTGGSIWLQKLV
jgi:predicted O-methyltransferase YrrM